jgi:hypothetical protein
MQGLLTNRRTPKLTGQGCLCLLLIGLLLYNPFAGLWGPTDRVSYDKLARNRATIGASELEHFSPVSNPGAQADLAMDVAATGLPELAQAHHGKTEILEILSPQAEYLLEFSNRPPPTL